VQLSLIEVKRALPTTYQLYFKPSLLDLLFAATYPAASETQQCITDMSQLPKFD
jgi:hypothetical protein